VSTLVKAKPIQAAHKDRFKALCKEHSSTLRDHKRRVKRSSQGPGKLSFQGGAPKFNFGS
ncbi:hypothetical protein ACFL2Q_18340, partial [Thermodesulfobacteriota bacterium]